MEFLGVKWSWGTQHEFWTLLLTYLVILAITFGGNQLQKKFRGKNWRERPSLTTFVLLLVVSITIGLSIHRRMF